MKKAQMEILGIAIVVVLATLGMLFVVKYSMTSSQTSKQSYKIGTTAENFLSVLMSTSTDCNNLVFSDVLKGCASGTVECIEYPKTEDQNSACVCAQDLMEKFLAASLDIQGLSYYVVAFKEDLETDEGPKIQISSGDCVNETGACQINAAKGCTGKREASQRFLPTTSGTRTLVFYICS